MAQGVSSHLNRSSNGYERSRAAMSISCAIWVLKVSTEWALKMENGRSIAVLGCPNIPEAVLTCC